MLTPFRTLVAFAAATAVAAPAFAQAPIPRRVTGNFSQNTKHVDGIERPFFTGLSGASGVPLAVTYNPLDVLGIQAADSLRHLRSGAFDVMSVQIGMVARDDPFFEGLDLIGVSTTMDAYGAASMRVMIGVGAQDRGGLVFPAERQSDFLTSLPGDLRAFVGEPEPPVYATRADEAVRLFDCLAEGLGAHHRITPAFSPAGLQ